MPPFSEAERKRIDAFQAESAKAQTMLGRNVAETSVAIAKRLAERPIELHRVTAVLAAVVAFGALCVTAGFKLGNTGTPFWSRSRGTPEGNGDVVAVVLGVPAGWMLFALLLPVAACGARSGWNWAIYSPGDAPLRVGERPVGRTSDPKCYTSL